LKPVSRFLMSQNRKALVKPKPGTLTMNADSIEQVDEQERKWSSSMNKKGSRDKNGYVVGKWRPPLSTQWKPGQSGNPKGRPKGAKNMMTYFRQELNRKISIKEGGIVRKVTSREAIAKTTVNLALKGDPKFIPVMMVVDREVSALDERKILRAIRENRTPRTAKEALEAYKRTLRGEDDEEDEEE
jgi:Family of unknown function (DUF5681)